MVEAGISLEAAAQPLYALLIGLRNDALILPNAALAEVMTRNRMQPRMQPLSPVPGNKAGSARIGSLQWQGRELPVISFEALNGGSIPPIDHRRARLVVLHALSERLPSRAYALLCQGHPQLLPLNAAAVQSAPLRSDDRPEFVLTRVRIATREALIPDMERIEAELAAALTGEA